MSNQQVIKAEFTENEIKLIDDALHFTRVCLDRESVNLFKDMSLLIDKIKILIPNRYVTRNETAL